MFWTKVKLLWTKIQPELIRFLKAALKLGIQALLPIAIQAVTQAESKGGTGREKFDYACKYVADKAPDAAIGAVMTAVQSAWASREAEDWK